MRHIHTISKAHHPAQAVNILALGQITGAFVSILNALTGVASIGFGSLVPIIVFAQEAKDFLKGMDTFDNN